MGKDDMTATTDQMAMHPAGIAVRSLDDSSASWS